jgi:hypothetical protein
VLTSRQKVLVKVVKIVNGCAYVIVPSFNSKIIFPIQIMTVPRRFRSIIDRSNGLDYIYMYAKINAGATTWHDLRLSDFEQITDLIE